MIKEINLNDFIQEFKDFNPYQFSKDGLKALFEYLSDFEENTGEQIKLDIISLCCDFSEYKDLREYLKDYGNQHEENQNEDNEDFKQRIEEEISEKTILIKFGEDLDGGFIIAQY
jgi:hypothetical protein